MADGAVTLVPPRPYKNRRGWLIAFGIFEILIGCVLLLLIALMYFGLRHAPPNAAPPADAATGMVMVAVMYGTLAILFVIVGIGNVQLKRWARITMLVVSWCWLAIGVLGTAMVAFLMPVILQTTGQQSSSPMPAGVDKVVRIVMFSAMAVFLILLPAIFLLFYNGKNVKATVNDVSNSGPAGPRKPVTVIVATVWFALGALTVLVVFQRPALPLFGLIVVGWGARLTAAVSSVISGWLAWNLYRQRAIAWRLAVAWISCNWASLLVTLSRLNLIEMYRRMGYSEAEVTRMMPFVSYGVYFGWALGVAFFIFLIAIRKQFNEPRALTA